jgi:hypothetical protein
MIKTPALEAHLAPEFELELNALRAEAMGWIPLDPGAYLHHGQKPGLEDALVIEVVGIPSFDMAGMNVLLLV